MIAQPPAAPLDPVECRFLFGDGEAEAICHRHLAADMRAARLSAAFRAYYRLRSLIPLRARQMLQRHRRVVTSPRWCYPDAFVDELWGQFASDPAVDRTLVHPWPNAAEFALVLTHDVETAEGIERIAPIADLEQALGFRSAWNFIPYKYPIDRGLLRDLAERGFEIGVHGYNHDGRLFTSRSVFDRRVPAINAAIESFGAVGFRAPMVHRNLGWLQSLDIQYDASCFDADPYQAMPGGVGSVWPFFAGRFVELPYTLPQDHTLFVVLGERDGRIWHEKLDFLAKLCGMALLVTHPDYLDAPYRLDAYRELLVKASAMNGMWHALPKEVAAWWRERDELTLRNLPNGTCQITGPAAGRARPTIGVLRPHAGDTNLCPCSPAPDL